MRIKYTHTHTHTHTNRFGKIIILTKADDSNMVDELSGNTATPVIPLKTE